MVKEKLTQEYLKECLTYNQNTGVFIWKQRPLHHFKDERCWKIWNTSFSGKIAGHLNKVNSYYEISVNDIKYYAHRLAYLYMEGYIPENYVDHIDRIKSNNIWDNLREVSNRCNLQNCNLSKNNKSGVSGVHFDKRGGKWVSYIKINYKRKSIGSFVNFEDAVKARYQEELDNPEWTCSVESSAYKYLKERNLV